METMPSVVFCHGGPEHANTESAGSFCQNEVSVWYSLVRKVSENQR